VRIRGMLPPAKKTAPIHDNPDAVEDRRTADRLVDEKALAVRCNGEVIQAVAVVGTPADDARSEQRGGRAGLEPGSRVEAGRLSSYIALRVGFYSIDGYSKREGTRPTRTATARGSCVQDQLSVTRRREPPAREGALAAARGG